MNSILSIIGLVCLAVVVGIARLLILCKIYAILAHVFGGPDLTLWQMFALTWFLSACTTGNESRDSKKKTTSDTVIQALGSLGGALIVWGLTYLVFGA